MKGAVFCAPFIYDLLSKSFWYILFIFIIQGQVATHHLKEVSVFSTEINYALFPV